MSSTSNLGLQIINGSDYISPDPINANMRAIDAALGIDYITQRGISGHGWWYRVWKSGRAECGIDAFAAGDIIIDQIWTTGVYFKEVERSRNLIYPVVFSGTPFFVATPTGPTGAGPLISYTPNANPKTTAPTLWLTYFGSTPTFQNMTFSMYACGGFDSISNNPS